MKYILLTLFSSSTLLLHSQKLELTGVYQERDVYVENPFAEAGVGFCVFEVLVNGEITSDEINSSAFAIDLTLHELKRGSEVEIVLKHKDGCTPKVINPEAIQPQSTFKVDSFKIDPSGKIDWTASNENGMLEYEVEQFKWNKWVEVGSVMGDGDPDATSYSVDVELVNGDNIFRLHQRDFDGDHFSDEMKYTSDAAEVTLKHTKVFEWLEFSQATHYELYNEYGELKATGHARKVDMTTFTAGKYYVNYGSHFGEIITHKN